LVLNVAVVAGGILGVGDENIDGDMFILRGLPGFGLERRDQWPISLRAPESIARNQELGGMLGRHSLIAQLDDGVQVFANSPDGVIAAVVLDRAGHLAVGPPHERHLPATILDVAPPNALPGILNDAGARSRQYRIVTESE